MGFFFAFAAHLGGSAKTDTNCWPLWMAEQFAAVVVAELHAAHAGGLAVRHARDR